MFDRKIGSEEEEATGKLVLFAICIVNLELYCTENECACVCVCLVGFLERLDKARRHYIYTFDSALTHCYVGGFGKSGIPKSQSLKQP